MKKLIVLVALLIVVVVVFVYLSTHKGSFSFQFPTNSQKVTAAKSPELATQVIPLTIKNGKVIQNNNIHVAEGQMVVLQIRSDTDDTLKVLGYDKNVFLRKGQMVVLSFLSTLVGDFAYKLQNGKAVLGIISVER